MKKKLTAIDLFSGAGGLHLGFEESGYDVKLCIDNDNLVEKTHKRNFPHIPMINGDIRDVTADQIREYLGGDSLDVIIGGPPCQGFSTIGHRASSDPNKRYAHDSRNELVLVYANQLHMYKKTTTRAGGTRKPFQAEMTYLKKLGFIYQNEAFKRGTGLNIDWPLVEGSLLFFQNL